MQVQVWVFERAGSRSIVRWRLEQLGLVAYETERDGGPALVVAVGAGREPEVERELRIWDGRMTASEDVADDGAVAQALRKRVGATPGGKPFDREQVGVRVVLEDGTVVDLDQGVSYEVRDTENLHVLRGERWVAVIRAGSWRYAERIFGDEVVAP